MVKAAGGAIIKDKKILLIKRAKNKEPFPNKWGFPSGKMDEGETPEEGAIREVKEEVGLDFKPTELILKGENEYSEFYRFTGEWSGEIKIQEEEIDDYGWFTYEEAKKLEYAFDYEKAIKILKEKSLL